MAWNISVGFPKISYETWRGEPCICIHRLQKLGVLRKWATHWQFSSREHFDWPWATMGHPIFQQSHVTSLPHTSTHDDGQRYINHIWSQWILNHPSINLQFLQKVNHRQPSWLSHRKPPSDRRASRLQRTQPDSQSLERHGENDENPLEKGPFPSPFSDKLMSRLFWGIGFCG